MYFSFSFVSFVVDLSVTAALTELYFHRFSVPVSIKHILSSPNSCSDPLVIAFKANFSWLFKIVYTCVQLHRTGG